MSKFIEKEESLLSNALESYCTGKFKSIQGAAAHFGVSKHKLHTHNKGTTNTFGCTATNKVLDKVQEKALITWIELLNLAYTPPMAKDIEATANRILKHGGSNQHVSKMYSYQFIACLPPPYQPLYTKTQGEG